MSIEIMNRVWSQSKQQGTKLVLLLALADMAKDDGYCWPSLETLQQRARLARYQNVIKAISEMENDGEIFVEHNRGRNRSNAYIVTVGMNVEELTSTLISKLNYQVDEAKKTAQEFLKCSPQTTFLKRSPEDKNVVVEVKNVVVEIEKRSPQTTLTIIEPIEKHNVSSATQTEHEKPLQPVGQTEKTLTPQQEYFSALCWVVGWDYKTITKEQSGQIAQTVGILQKAGYTKDDLRAFWSNVWAKDWRWTKKQQRPTVTDVRANIGKVKTTATPPAYVNGNAPLVKSVFAQDFTESEA